MDPWLKTILLDRGSILRVGGPYFAILGDAPVSLLVQQKRWTVGVLEVAFLKCSPLTFGSRAMGPLAGPGYSMYAFYPIYSIRRLRRSNILQTSCSQQIHT
jgi:hypothetical protein